MMIKNAFAVLFSVGYVMNSFGMEQKEKKFPHETVFSVAVYYTSITQKCKNQGGGNPVVFNNVTTGGNPIVCKDSVLKRRDPVVFNKLVRGGNPVDLE